MIEFFDDNKLEDCFWEWLRESYHRKIITEEDLNKALKYNSQARLLWREFAEYMDDDIPSYVQNMLKSFSEEYIIKKEKYD